MTKPRNNNKTKENNKSGKDTSGKRPASSFPAGNVSGQGPTSSSPPENTSPSTTSSNKKARVVNESDMDIENTFNPPLIPSARCQGSNELKRIIVHFRTKDDMEKATADHMDSLFGLHFHPYDPSAIKANENERTLVVTDIPLFLNNALLRDTFSHFGNITKCHTKLAKLYRTAYITFESMDAISKFDDTWAILFGGHCLCVCPASFSLDQRKERRTYVALLAGLSRGTVAADLAEIAHEVFATSPSL
ncbi:hypothetical protein C1646_822147 [Rhizophagus diaphanus]|nr:hypothetical protein C1646_822147 [Rhizophagus diaphanus] [Rhizophagus sp. MUCL 43196]